jgi:hypothetical protein
MSATVNELRVEVESLKEENQRYLETIIKKSKSNAETILSGGSLLKS